MSGEVYVIKTGEKHYFFDNCRKGNYVALMFDQPFFDAWKAGDSIAHLAVAKKFAKPGATEADIKSTSTTWYGYAEKLSGSVADIFIVRDGNDLYWATTTEGSPFFIPHEHDGVVAVAICKPVDGWNRFTISGVPLKWETIHKKAREDYLSPYPALFRVANDEMRDYLHAMLEGANLTTWHQQGEWKKKQGEDKGKFLGNQVSLIEKSILDLFYSITHTSTYSNGQLVMTRIKDKNIIDMDDEELKTHLRELWTAQDGRCKLTGLAMHHKGQDGYDKELKISPDRIDSNGQYAKGNIQLVCSFVNTWKGPQPNEMFLKLLDLVVASKSAA